MLERTDCFSNKIKDCILFARTDCLFDHANIALQILQFMKERNYSKVEIKPELRFGQCHALEEVKIYEKQL